MTIITKIHKITHIKNNSYQLIHEKPINSEKYIQNIIETNLKVFFDLELVKSEVRINQFRFDTLAFDNESNSFVVIEYKKKTDKGLFDQGLGYLELLSSSQADFLVEYNEQTGKSLRKKDVDWRQSKIIFIAPSFNASQIQAANFDFNLELWEIHLYSKMIELKRHQNTNKTVLPIKGSKKQIIEKFKTYTEEYHFNKRPNPKMQLLYEKYRDYVTTLPDAQINIRKHYIVFKTNFNFVAFILRKNLIIIHIGGNLINDPKNIVKNVKHKGHWATGNHLIRIENETNFDYICDIIKNSYDDISKRTLSDVANKAVKNRKSQ